MIGKIDQQLRALQECPPPCEKKRALNLITAAMVTLLQPAEGGKCEYEIVQDLAVVAKHLKARIK